MRSLDKILNSTQRRHEKERQSTNYYIHADKGLAVRRRWNKVSVVDSSNDFDRLINAVTIRPLHHRAVRGGWDRVVNRVIVDPRAALDDKGT